MGILQYPTPIPATVGTLPTLKFMISSDSLAALTTAGYLNGANLDAANPISNNDVIMALYNYNAQTTSGTFGIFAAILSGATGAITLVSTAYQQSAVVTLTAAQVRAMYVTPQLIVPAPATGYALIPTACQIVTLVSTAFANGGAAQLQWSNTTEAGGTLALDATTPAAEITAASSQVYTQYGIVTTSATAIANLNGLGLYFTNATGAFTAGGGSTVTVAVSYMVVPV